MVDDAMPAQGSQPAPVPWWSYTKTTLAAAALALVAKSRLGLDAPLRPSRDTLRQLLRHRASLPNYGPLAACRDAVATGAASWARDLLLRRVRADTLVFEPGQGWAYSNVGHLLVRELVEDAAGQELGAALDELVFRPLGVAGVVVAREPADLAATAWGNPAGYHPGWVCHGLLTGPAGAAASLLHRLLGGALLPGPPLAEMLAPHPVAGPVHGRPWQVASYGLGPMVGVGAGGAAYVGHTGGGPGSTVAIYQSRPGRTAAAAAPTEDPSHAEREAMDLARLRAEKVRT